MKSKVFSGVFSAIIALVICMLSGFTEFASECEAVRGSALRLHIRASSDSALDQSAKLAVRDALTEQFCGLFADSDGLASAVNTAEASLSALESTANGVLAGLGLCYTAKASVVTEYFATTDYGDFALPAGQYRAIRIDLGAASGKNWFCIAFPPLCLAAASEKGAAELAALQKDGGWRVTSKKGGYILKFRLLELLRKLARD